VFILGTTNFGQKYNGSELSKKECFKILEEYKKLGGVYLDTAFNYGNAQEIIGEFGADLFKINTKSWHDGELEKSLEILKVNKIYSCMTRDSTHWIGYVLKQRVKKGIIEKWGSSIYYPHELRGDANITFIPFTKYFLDYMPVMMLHGDVWIRSYFNLDSNLTSEDFKKYERKDLGHEVHFVGGVDNVFQLRENMEFFNA